MKVLFIGSSSLGPRYIMSLLKQNGHEAVGIYQGIDDYLGEPSSGFNEPISMEKLSKEKPDIIGFSIDSICYIRSLEMARKAKVSLPSAFVIFGGVHPTILPDQVIANEFVDAVCLGEGEHPMLELCNTMQRGEDYRDISNLWVKADETVVRNPLRPYVQDLDAIEMDREGLYYYGVFTGRGCTGNCSFCNTPAMRKTGATGKYLRKRSVENVLDEIDVLLETNKKLEAAQRKVRFVANIRGIGELKKSLSSRNSENTATENFQWLVRVLGSRAVSMLRRSKPEIRFKDDSFLTVKEWFLEFAQRYSKRFPRLPYLCNARADEIDEEVGEWLRKSGCQSVGLGFECGNEVYRNKVLKKRISNRDILSAVGVLSKNNVPILGQWMVGMPGETIENVLESIELSVRIGDIPQVHIAVPFPKSEMHQLAVDMGLISEDYIPDEGTYAIDFLFHEGDTKKMMRLLYLIFNFKDVYVPRDYELLKHVGRLGKFANQKLGRIVLSEIGIDLSAGST
jgi:radical SAM superfamily enzyme YgiQ (UPF0313 family)